MPRIRTIKPSSSFNDRLYDLEVETGFPLRFVWAVLPCHCDREGRFKYQPRQMQPQILPFDGIDFSRVLDALWTSGFIEKYSDNGEIYGVIPTFLKHQVVNNRESASELPEPSINNILACESREIHATFTRDSRVPQGKEGKGKEGKGESDASKDDAIRLIDYLNTKANKQFRPTDSNLKFLLSRFAEKFTFDDIKNVIDFKVSQWSSDKKMSQYLRPSTLFNAEKFNQYFGELGNVADDLDSKSTVDLIEMANKLNIPNAENLALDSIKNKIREARA